jgi:hypothetical protein
MEKMREQRNFKKMGFGVAVVLLCVGVIYMLTLYVLTQIKIEEQGPSFEYMTQHPGKYESNLKIGKLTLSKTITEIDKEGEVYCYTKNYPIQFWLPMMITVPIVGVMLGFGVVLKKKARKMKV